MSHHHHHHPYFLRVRWSAEKKCFRRLIGAAHLSLPLPLCLCTLSGRGGVISLKIPKHHHREKTKQKQRTIINNNYHFLVVMSTLLSFVWDLQFDQKPFQASAPSHDSRALHFLLKEEIDNTIQDCIACVASLMLQLCLVDNLRRVPDVTLF